MMWLGVSKAEGECNATFDNRYWVSEDAPFDTLRCSGSGAKIDVSDLTGFENLLGLVCAYVCRKCLVTKELWFECAKLSPD
jgi:hypothetical protein